MKTVNQMPAADHPPPVFRRENRMKVYIYKVVFTENESGKEIFFQTLKDAQTFLNYLYKEHEIPGSIVKIMKNFY